MGLKWLLIFYVFIVYYNIIICFVIIAISLILSGNTSAVKVYLRLSRISFDERRLGRTTCATLVWQTLIASLPDGNRVSEILDSLVKRWDQTSGCAWTGCGWIWVRMVPILGPIPVVSYSISANSTTSTCTTSTRNAVSLRERFRIKVWQVTEFVVFVFVPAPYLCKQKSKCCLTIQNVSKYYTNWLKQMIFKRYIVNNYNFYSEMLADNRSVFSLILCSTCNLDFENVTQQYFKFKYIGYNRTDNYIKKKKLFFSNVSIHHIID